MKNLKQIFIYVLLHFLIGSCHQYTKQNETNSVLKFKNELITEIKHAKNITIVEHDWFTDQEDITDEAWGIRYKKLNLNKSDAIELIEIVKNLEPKPRNILRPQIASFHHTIIFKGDKNKTYLKISTVNNVCTWNGSTELTPEALCSNLILFLEKRGFETSNSEAFWINKSKR